MTRKQKIDMKNDKNKPLVLVDSWLEVNFFRMLQVLSVLSVLVVCFVVPGDFEQTDTEDIHFRITDGVRAARNEFPFMVMLLHLNGQFLCGGSLISENYVITAAHCVKNKLATSFVVGLGDYDRNTSSDGPHVNINVSKIIPHPWFNTAAKTHDIALLRLADKVNMSSFISTICLAERRKSFDGETAKIAGWGSISVDSFSVHVLRKLEMTILSHDHCCDLLNYECDEILTEEKICAFREDAGACRSDSGGPLVWEDPKTKKPQLVGIISLGLCGKRNLPGIFTRISSYLDWIQENTFLDNSICWI